MTTAQQPTGQPFETKQCNRKTLILAIAGWGCFSALALVCFGYWLGAGPTGKVAWNLPSTPIYASATDSSEDLVIATGSMVDKVEGLFALDALSGDLQCTVFNPTSSVFNTAFRRNVLGDLGLDAAKNPRFLMVTGGIQSIRRASRSGHQLGACLVYVVEANSGNFAVYAVPWRRELFDSGRPQQDELVLVQSGSMRTAAVRE